MRFRLNNDLGTWTVLAVLFGLVLLILFFLVAMLALLAMR
jgi:hypothetical protein